MEGRGRKAYFQENNTCVLGYKGLIGEVYSDQARWNPGIDYPCGVVCLVVVWAVSISLWWWRGRSPRRNVFLGDLGYRSRMAALNVKQAEIILTMISMLHQSLTLLARPEKGGRAS